MYSELLLEIGTEEIPAAFMPGILDNICRLAAEACREARIDAQRFESCGTPRRIVLIGHGLAERQQDLVERRMGPALRIAYDETGAPTKAAQGFARGQGLAVDQLQTVETDKGAYVCAEVRQEGRPTAELLPTLLPGLITQLPVPKSMRWQNLEMRFARPIHWIVALLDGQVIPFSLAGIASGSHTRGHRFMAPDPIEVTGVAHYRQALEQAGVMLDPVARRQLISAQIEEFAVQADAVPDRDAGLLDEVTWLVEGAYPMLCGIDERFLALPPEVLLTTMKKHQRYFPLLGRSGRPVARFVAVNNTRSTRPEVVRSGHERVLRARLADAEFFYREDQKRTMDGMTDELRQVVFQAKLGTSFEKVNRFQQLAVWLAETAVPAADPRIVERAAYLCKADLVSEMVGEFPELQGIMGREYARLAGEPDAVCQAVFEHYQPRFAGDELPASAAGAVVSIADKMDTIVGCFGIGLAPTGTADPYALRRQCLGIINIVRNQGWALSLRALIERALQALETKLTLPAATVRQDVEQFFIGRLTSLLTGSDYAPDVVESVLAHGLDDIADALRRIDAVRAIKPEPDFASLAASCKRVVNILGQTATGAVDAALLTQGEEQALHRALSDARDRVARCMADSDYAGALRQMATLRQPVDAFFDHVMVMVDDERVRANRLALLQAIHQLFSLVADVTRICAD